MNYYDELYELLYIIDHNLAPYAYLTEAKELVVLFV